MTQLLDIARPPRPPRVLAEAISDASNYDITTVAVVCAALVLLAACLIVAGRVRKHNIANN